MRKIHKSASTAAMEVSDLLSSVFHRLLVLPDDELWLVSPWITDVPVLDLQASSIDLRRSLGSRSVGLVAVLSELAERGTAVTVITRDDPINSGFISRFGVEQRREARGQRLRLHLTNDELHTKCLVGSDFVVGGSMNFTNKGAMINDELVTFEVGVEVASAARLELVDRFRFGGASR